jgi:hypothetical protein
MVTDMFGRNRLKINLHLHTTESDGCKTPEEAAAVYKAAGYDIIAVTDHWKYRGSGEIGGLRILSGAEYNIGGGNGAEAVYHILALGCAQDPLVRSEDPVQTIIDRINRCGGMAVLAHPAWSLNTVEQADGLRGIGATEIYNTVSDAGESSRPYSGYFADCMACRGQLYPLIADDDTHYYDGSDETISYIMLACGREAADGEILEAIRKKDFYASQGPEIHLFREGNRFSVKCSPVSRISFFSNAVWARGRCVRGENLTEASCEMMPFETFIRAEVTDADGRKAWTNSVEINQPGQSVSGGLVRKAL